MGDMEALCYEDWVGELNTEDAYSFEFDDCDSNADQDVAQESSMAPDQLEEDRSRDVCIVSKVCNIDEQVARELLVRESWDHQKILELHYPFQGMCSGDSLSLSCPVCLESCSVGSSNGTQFFELCDHPMHTECAREFVKNEINLMAGLNQEQFRGSVTCPWCIALKVRFPGFLSESAVATLASKRDYQTYTKARNCTLARNERHCPRQGCTNIVRFSSVKLNSSALCPTLECSCGHRFCLLCRCTEHWPASCQRVADWTQMEARIQEDTLDLQRELENTKQRERNLRVDLAVPRDLYVQEAMAGEEEEEEAVQEELVRVFPVEENFMREGQMVFDPDLLSCKISPSPGLELQRSQRNGISLLYGLEELIDVSNHVSGIVASYSSPATAFAHDSAVVQGIADPQNHVSPTTCLQASRIGASQDVSFSFQTEASPAHQTPRQTCEFEYQEEFDQVASWHVPSTRQTSGEEPTEDRELIMSQEQANLGEFSETNLPSCCKDKAMSHFLNTDPKPHELVYGSSDGQSIQLHLHDQSEQLLAPGASLKSDAGRKKRELDDCSQISLGNKCHRRVELKRNYHSWTASRSKLVQANKNIYPTYFSKCKKGYLGCEDPLLCSPRAKKKMNSPPARPYLNENSAKSDTPELAFLRKGKISRDSVAMAEDVNVVSLDDSKYVDDVLVEKDLCKLEQEFVNLEATDVNFRNLNAIRPSVDFRNATNPLNDSKKEGSEVQVQLQDSIDNENNTENKNNTDKQLIKSNSAVSVDEIDLNDGEACNTYIAKNIKDCPKCFCLCEKLSGCDHVRCPRCGHQFCWRCRTDWTLAGSYKHVKHCVGEALSIPTTAEAEEQYQAFLTRHGCKESETLASKEEFMDEWLSREKQMRRDFDYGNNRSGQWDVRRRVALNMGLAHMNRLREQANQLLVRLQEQERNIELRKKYLISQSLKRGITLDEDSPTSGSSTVQLEADYARYASVNTQWRNVEKSVAQHKVLNEHSKDLPSDCCFYLSKILISCQTTLWAYKLDRFFDSHVPVDALVEYNAMELERVESVYTTLEQIIRQLTEDGNGSLSSSDEACSSHGLTRETLANSAEYYRRKRNNFTDAWENAVSNRQGKSSGSLGISDAEMNEITCAD